MKEKGINTNGVTLVELMIAIVLGLAISGLAYFAYNTHGASAIVQQEVASMQQDLVMCLNMIEKDVRNAGCNPKMSNFNPFSGLLATTLGINYDLRELSDNTVLGGPNRPPCDQIIYSRSADNNLIRKQSNRGLDTFTDSILARDVSIFAVTYTTGSLGRTPQENNIRMVTVSISKTSSRNDAETGRPITKSITRSIAVRNYKRNS